MLRTTNQTRLSSIVHHALQNLLQRLLITHPSRKKTPHGAKKQRTHIEVSVMSAHQPKTSWYFNAS